MQPGEHTFEKVRIDGQDYGVPQAVVQEIEALREKAVGGIRGFKPAEGETIIITTPAGASREFVEAVMHAAHENFPDESVAVVPEDLEFHTQKGFVALVEAGQAMCDRILHGGSEAAYEGSVEEAANEWKRVIGEKDGDGNPS